MSYEIDKLETQLQINEDEKSKMMPGNVSAAMPGVAPGMMPSIEFQSTRYP